jgi:uncharacterized OB-fold protein
MAVRLQASRCRLCGGLYHPLREICPRCGPKSKGSLEKVELPEGGRLIAYTVLHYPPEGYPSPMILAVAEIGGVKLIGRVVGDPEAIREGCEVAVEKEGAPYLFLPRGSVK